MPSQYRYSKRRAHRRRYWTEYYTAMGCSYNKVQKLVGRKMRWIA